MGITSNRLSAYASVLLLVVHFGSFAQQPFINSISTNHAEVGNTVEISGLNFNGSPQVFFGGVEANLLSNSARLISVEVPAGAANASIFVLNNSLVAQSNEQFYISYGGTEVNAHDPEFAVSTTEFAASDLCLCDLNGDHKNDIVIVQNRDADQSGAEATIFLNNIGDNDTDAFTGSDFQISQSLNISGHVDGFGSVACADLDNDGNNDLAFTSNFGTDVNDVYIVRNPGTGVFPQTGGQVLPLVLPQTAGGDQRQPGAIVAADLDRDGLLDIAVGNNAGDGVFHIFRNIGTPGSMAFDNAVEIAANGEPTGLLFAADLNNDGNQDIVSLPFRESNSGINLLRNLSIPGAFNFVVDQTISNGGQTSDIEVGDLDNDGDLEIVVASNLTGRLSFFENQSGSLILFGGPNDLSSTASTATGVSLADMNGDGSLDITATNGAGGIFIFPNQTDATISFGDEQIQSTGGTARNIVTGDLNGDAKPDMAYSRSVNLEEIGFLGLIVNRNCIIPQISPQEFEFCLGDPFTLETVRSTNATYNWQVLTGNGTITTNGNPTAEVTINSGANASIRVTVTQDDCTETSETLNLSVAGGTPPGTPTINVSSAGILCAGDVVVVSSSLTSDNYFWTTPNGDDITTAIIQLDPVTPEDAGTYTLSIQDADGCISEVVSRTIEVSSPPELSIVNSGLINFCDEIELQVPDYSSTGITYQWKESGANINETSSSLTVSASGTYTLEATNSDNCSTETSSITVNKVELPTSLINGPTETCEDFLTTFSAASTGAAGFSLQYDWLVQDAADIEILSSSDQAIDFAFEEGNYTITLTTSYDPAQVYPGPDADDLCASTMTLDLVVSTAPTITFSVDDLIPKCQDESLSVGLGSPNANEISSYSWSVRGGNTIINSANTASIDVATPIGVDTVYAIVDIVTTIGCQIRDSIRVRNFLSDVDISSPDFTTILSNDSATLEDNIFINLTAENLTANIAWDPAEFFDDATATSVQYFPRIPTSTVTLSGTDADGCNVATQVTIYLDNIRPQATFSPNGDGINDCWEILNIGELGESAGCELYIFDSRGRNETPVITSFQDGNCVWNGTSSGTNVPEGVYYYVLKCNQEEFSKTGSILLAR